MLLLKRKMVQIQVYCWITLYFFEKITKFLLYSKVERLVMLTRTLNLSYLSEKNKKYVNEFNDYMIKAKKEYEKNAGAFVEQKFRRVIEDPDWDPAGDLGVEFYNVKQDILQNSSERLNESNEHLRGNMKERENIMSEQDIRELNGVLDPKGRTPEEKINFLEIQAEHWRKKALLEVDQQKERWYKDAEILTRRVADRLRLDNDIKPEEE